MQQFPISNIYQFLITNI